jgi:hypothetical protein
MLEVITLDWTVVGIVVPTIAAVAARSVALGRHGRWRWELQQR